MRKKFSYVERENQYKRQSTKIWNHCIKRFETVRQCISFCLKCKKKKKKIEIKNPEVSDTKNGKIIISSRCQLCSSKRWRFITEQGASRVFWQLGSRTPLGKILLLLLMFVPEMHLKQPGFINSASEPFIKQQNKTTKIQRNGTI